MSSLSVSNCDNTTWNTITYSNIHVNFLAHNYEKLLIVKTISKHRIMHTFISKHNINLGATTLVEEICYPVGSTGYLS